MSIKYNGGYIPAVGADGTTLVANSASATGVAWAGPTFTAGKNKIINGDFGIWQRGTSFTATGTETYTADRWLVSSGGGGVCAITQQTFTPGSAPVSGYEGKYFLQANYTTSGTTTVGLTQKIEDVRTFAGQTVTVSFWARVTSGTFAGVGPDLVQYFGSSGSSTVVNTSSSGAVTLTTSWQRFSFPFTLPSISGKTIAGGNDALWARINLGTTGTNTFQYWGFQVEAGSVATAFQTATGTLQGELAACQRYYQKHQSGLGAGVVTGAAAFDRLTAPFPVTMRIAPSISQSAVGIYDGTTATAISSLGTNYSTTTIFQIGGGCTGATFVTGRPAIPYNSGSSFWELSAEL
jgi:hypothetical protein